jgi:DNA-binding MltR family transcriptional regulator
MQQDAESYIFRRFDLVMEFRRGLSGETDRGCALMAAEYLSSQLSELLRAHFVDDSSVCDSVLENPNGALSTFSARIEFAYLLGDIGPVARREMHLIRKIRNEFAHEYTPLAFTEDRVAARCRELRAHVLIPDPSPRTTFVRTVMGLLAVVHARTAVVKHAVLCEQHAFELSREEQNEIQESIRKIVEELLSDSPPEGDEADAGEAH